MGLSSRLLYFASGFFASLAIAAPIAHATNNVAWLLVDQPTTTGEYSPNPAHSFNSTHGGITIFREGAGVYLVFVDNFYLTSEPGNSQVSAYNSTAYCKTNGYTNSGTAAELEVECANGSGQYVDTEFALLVQTRSAPFALGSAKDGIAYLMSAGTSGPDEVENSYNSLGGKNTSAQSGKVGIGAGNYTVTLPGFGQQGGNVLITPLVGGENLSLCKAVDWAASGGNTTVTVQCYRADNGLPTYSPFSVAYAIGEPFGLVPGQATLGAWLWTNDPTSTAAYTPNPHFQYNGFKTGAMTAQKTSTGHYTVTIPGTLTYSSSVALVTAWGAGTDHCSIGGTTTNTINVVCYDHTGAFADSRFNVTFQTAR